MMEMEESELFVDGKRIDGRGPTDLRPLKITAGVLRKAEGSCMIEWGRNKVLAGVYGPREVVPRHLTDLHKAIIYCTYAMASFSSQEEHGRAGPNRRAIEIGKVTKHVFENNVLVNEFPKTTIDITIEVLQSDGGTRAAGITAASVALVDAGIPVRDLVQCVSVGRVNGQLVVDLNKEEDNLGSADIPMAFSLSAKELLLFQLDGMLSKEEVSQSIDMAMDAAAKVRDVQVAALEEKYGSLETVLEK